MSRQKATKPWHHQSSGYWCTTIAGKRHYLDRDYKIARRKLRELRAKEKREAAGVTEWLDEYFATLVHEYLTDLKERRKPSTYRGNRYRLLRCLKILGTDLRVGQIKKLHLVKIEQAMTGNYSPTTIADTITCVQGVFNWAVKYDLLEYSPLIGFDKPSRRSRHRIIEPEEFQALLRHSDVNLRRLLMGCPLHRLSAS